jgi:hypothetical protein
MIDAERRRGVFDNRASAKEIFIEFVRPSAAIERSGSCRSGHETAKAGVSAIRGRVRLDFFAKRDSTAISLCFQFSFLEDYLL